MCCRRLRLSRHACLSLSRSIGLSLYRTAPSSCWSLFFCVSILAYVLHSGRVTSDKIFAAISVYLLLGFAWTYAYALLDDMQPGSFADSTETGRTDYVAHVMQLRYFSFVTLTTLGYGDVLPRSSAARTMATLEAVMGQIYLAVLVARLVGLHIVHASKPWTRDDN